LPKAWPQSALLLIEHSAPELGYYVANFGEKDKEALNPPVSLLIFTNEHQIATEN
jgi:hypothetical protein